MVFTLEDINNLLAACGVCAEEELLEMLKEKDYGFKSDPNGRFAPALFFRLLPYVYRVVDGKTEYVVFNEKDTKALMGLRKVDSDNYEIYFCEERRYKFGNTLKDVEKYFRKYLKK